jgi:uncharacterized protein (DUF2147 family)
MLQCPRNLIRTIILSSGISLVAGALPAMAADPTGDWQVADGTAHIRVAQCGGDMWGVVSWEKRPGGRDDNNPDVSKRSRPTLGMPILLDMKKKPGAEQWEGQVYNAKDGKLYDSTITPTGPDQLEIRGCVLGFLCGGETWTRVGPPIPVSASAKSPGRTTGSAAKGQDKGQKQAVQPGDVGDVCLLPDVARFAH